MLAALSPEAVEQITEITKSAAGQEPYAYLVLLFAGVVVAVMAGFVWRLVVRFITHVESREEAERGRLQTMEKMQATCHDQAQRHLETVVKASTECRATVAENSIILAKLDRKLQT